MKLARVRTNSILNCWEMSLIILYKLVLKKQKNERPLIHLRFIEILVERIGWEETFDHQLWWNSIEWECDFKDFKGRRETTICFSLNSHTCKKKSTEINIKKSYFQRRKYA